MTKQTINIERIKVEELKNGINYIGYYKAIKRDDLKKIRDYMILDKYSTSRHADITMDILDTIFGLDTKAMVIFINILENNELDQAIKEIEDNFIIRII